jgi:diguanylate cyclase (GGDEF)-like protein
MTITISTQRPIVTSHGRAASNVMPLFDAAPETTELRDAGRILHLTNQLQTSLSVEEILTRFSDEVNVFVPHDFIGYKAASNSDNKSFDFELGKNRRQQQEFELILNSTALGSLVFSRKRKFTETETVELEYLISALLYPLRNALLYQEALQAAQKDALTGVCNRAALDDVLTREVDLAHRHERSLGMIIIDIDHFKSINDNYGHAAGDYLIKALAQSAKESIRNSDQIFRFGGEEFVVILPETGARGVKRLAERIRRNIEAMESPFDGNTIKMTASLGVATLNSGEEENDFFSRADKALYQAKHAGRNCVRFAE